MKVLFYRYGSICEPDIAAAFEEFGFLCYEMKHEIEKKDYTPQENIQKVSEYLMNHPTDLVFSINFFRFLSEVCNIFHIPYFSWIVDSPVMELFSVSIKNPYNRVFLFDRKIYEEIHPLNPACIFHLPLAVNVSDKQKIVTQATEAQRRHFSADISFVGSLYTEKSGYERFRSSNHLLKGYLEGLMNAQLQVYGYYFIDDCVSEDLAEQFRKDFPGFYTYPSESYLTDAMTLSQLYLGTHVTVMERKAIMETLGNRFSVDLYTASDTSALPMITNRGLAKTMTEMPIIFHESKINLNPTAKSIRSGVPLRVFDILGCGGFLVSNYQPELMDYFTPGVDLDTYSSMEELSEKCAFYLEHESIRREIAQNGLDKVTKDHNYLVRLTQMFEIAFTKEDP